MNRWLAWLKIAGESFLLFGILGFVFYLNGNSLQAVEKAPDPAASRPVLKFRLASEGLPAAGMWKSTPAVTRMQGNGKLVVAAHPRLGNGTHVWVMDDSGKWVEISDGLKMESPSTGGGVSFGDINRDGALDLAVADHGKGIFVYAGGPDGLWAPVTSALNPLRTAPAVSDPNANDESQFFIGAEDLALGDVNGDGFLDIVAAASDRGGFTVYMGDGSFAWKEAANTGLPTRENPEPEDTQDAGWANQVRLVDINRDGHLDVVASYYKGPSVWLGDGKGHFSQSSDGFSRPTIGGLYRGIAYGDINKDGLTDLVFANEVNGPEVYFQQVGGSWKNAPDVFPSLMGGAIAVGLADLTGDGNLDLIVAGRKNRETGDCFGIFVLKGDGKGGVVEAETNLPETGLSLTWGVTVADLANHGARDIVLTTGGVSTLPSSRARKDTNKVAENKQPPLPRLQVWLNETKDAAKAEMLSGTQSKPVTQSK